MVLHAYVDTLAYANKLKSVGVDSKHAEAQAELQAEVIASLFEDELVTQQNLLSAKIELKQEIAEFRAEVKQEFIDVREEMRTEFAAIRQEFLTFKNEIYHELKELENRLNNRLIWSISFLSVLITVFHFMK